MNIKSILARLHDSLEPHASANQLMLLPGLTQSTSSEIQPSDRVVLVVGYNGSSHSQAALDLAFCVAHQMRLVIQKQVVIHVIYVIDQFSSSKRSNLEQVDRVLWQARCLAEEWRGSFNVHLRFGNTATEISACVTDENAALLFLGCETAQHSLVQQFAQTIHCPVVGIPATPQNDTSDISSDCLLNC
jgi:Universal stress protein family